MVAGVTYGTTAAAIPGALGSSVPEPTKNPNVRSTAKKRIDSIKETIENISDEERYLAYKDATLKVEPIPPFLYCSLSVIFLQVLLQ